MWKSHSFASRYTMLALALLLLIVLFPGCGTAGLGFDVPTSVVVPDPAVPAAASPTVDIAQARAVFEAGGELTYPQVIALKQAIVGDPGELERFQNTDEYDAKQSEYLARMNRFALQLAKCRLKASIGWISNWGPEYTKDYQKKPGLARVYVYMTDPYSDEGKEQTGYPAMYIVEANAEQMSKAKAGQRIQFSGDLAFVDNRESVRNAKYEFLEDDAEVPTPSAAELQNLHIVLERTMCFGSCPDYSLTVNSDGQVTFEGRNYTKVKGTATAVIDKAKLEELVREIKKSDFFNLLDKYSVNVTDNPTYRLTITLGDNSKSVENYATGPRKLYLLQNRIDQIAGSDQWISCSPDPCQ